MNKNASSFLMDVVVNKPIIDDKILELKRVINESNNIVFFGGAGVSTESGIPDFRSVDGLYKTKYRWPPESILTASFFFKRQQFFYEFYKDKMLCLDAKPNKAHIVLAELEKQDKLKAVITQNIDGLHYLAGSKNVLELHGSVHRNTCLKCKKIYNAEFILNSEAIPKCSCGGIIKPDVTLYSEMLDMELLKSSINYISKADVLIVAGTSLTVFPAASLINYYKGTKLIVINRDTLDVSKAYLNIKGSVGEVLGKVSGMCNTKD